MTWILASVWSIILGIIWYKHQQTSFPYNNVLFITDIHAIWAVVQQNLSLSTNKQHWTDLFDIMGRWETPATCSYPHQDPYWVWGTRWLLLIPFWHEANYIVLRTFHFFWLSPSSPIPNQQIMDTRPPQPGASWSKSCWLADATSNTSLIGTQQE